MSGGTKVHTITDLRAAGAEAGWSAETLARHLGISRNRLFQLQREGDSVPANRVAAAERVMQLATSEARRVKLEAEALAATLATWRRDADDWASSMLAAGTRRQVTIDLYFRHLGLLATDLASRVPDPWLLPSHVLEEWLTSKGWSLGTRRGVMTSLRAFYSWGMVNGRCTRSPLAGLAYAPPTPCGPKPKEWPAAWVGPISRYLAHVQAGGRERSTLRVYRDRLVHLAGYFADPWQVTPEDLVQYCCRPDMAPNYRRSVTTTVQGFYRWAERAGELPSGTRSPAEDLPTVRVRRAVPRPAPDEAVLQGLEAADHRLYLALSIGLYAGLRVAEIAGIHSDDIGADVLLVRGKGGNERLVPLHPELAVQLRTELRRRREGGPLLQGWGAEVPRENGWLFPSRATNDHLSAATLSRLLSRTLPDEWTAHSLRHRFASQAYRETLDLRAVQELLGHTKPETTAIYAAVPGESLRAAVLGVGPVTAPQRTVHSPRR